jgi:hypothetical protein
MITQRFFPSSIMLSAVLALSACGGTSSFNADNAANEFSTKITSYLSALTSSAGLTSNALTDLFAAKYLDGGFTKTDLTNSLTANTTALGTSPELSLFPLATVTNSKLSGCDSSGICTLSGTLTNSDADTTSVDFTTKVIVIANVIYFYGDQSSTTPL